MPGSWGSPWFGCGTRYGSVHRCTPPASAIIPQDRRFPLARHGSRSGRICCAMPTACHAARRCVCVSGNGSRLSSGQGAGAITLGGFSSPLNGAGAAEPMYDLSRLAQALGCEPLGPWAFGLSPLVFCPGPLAAACYTVHGAPVGICQMLRIKSDVTGKD